MRLGIVLVVCVLANGPQLWADDSPISFQRDVLPILSDRCFSCHGPDAHSRQADLRLDVRDAAVDHGAIVPGDADAGEMLRRILATDPDEVMPPPAAQRKPLTDAEKQILHDWIRDGAEYQGHWSFSAPKRAAAPQATTSGRTRNFIDQFVLARLEREGISPSPEADRRTLIRRLSLDLTGLPPSAEEVNAFVNDPSGDAYEKLVQRLLDSPHFGERMALDWLDASRYADTNGYSIDGGRKMWLWRDWVINAFNSNMPYDQFLTEQLAGDLLPNPSDAQLIATGFQRNNMVTNEGGTIPEENLTKYNVDRVQTLGEAVLGLTLGCAQCHDHKFDPISQRDFYRFYAYFNSLTEQGLDGNNFDANPRPVFHARTVLQTDELPELNSRIAEIRRRLSDPDPVAVAEWIAQLRAELRERGADLKLHPVELVRVSTSNQSADYFQIDEHGQVSAMTPKDMLAYDVSIRLPAGDAPITGLRVVFYRDPRAPGGGMGHGKSLSTPITQILSSQQPPPKADPDALPHDPTELRLRTRPGGRQVQGLCVNLGV